MSMFWNWISNQFANVFHRNEWITKSSNESNECWVYYEINLSKTLNNNHNEKKTNSLAMEKNSLLFRLFLFNVSLFHKIHPLMSMKWRFCENKRTRITMFNYDAKFLKGKIMADRIQIWAWQRQHNAWL